MPSRVSLILGVVGVLLCGGAPWATAQQPRSGALASLTPAQRVALRTTATVRGVRRVARAVIAIISAKRVKKNPFYQPGHGGGAGGSGQAKRYSLGSGVIVNAQGYAVTNEHVISRATEIRVQLANGKRYKARVVGAAREYDLAVIKIQTKEKLPVAQLGRSANLMAGETAIAMIQRHGVAWRVNLRPGDVIQQADRYLVRHLKDLRYVTARLRAGRSVILRVQRGAKRYYVTVPY